MNYKEYKSPSFIEAYKNAFTSGLDFDGRSRRAEYWKFLVLYYLLSIIVFAISMMAIDTFDAEYVGWTIMIIFCLVHLLPRLSLQARRLHDIGRSAKMIFFLFVPFVGSAAYIVILIFSLFDSHKKGNNWGESPKYYVEND